MPTCRLSVTSKKNVPLQPMLQVGLIGTPLGHSGSADYFARCYPDCRYRAYELSSLDKLRTLVKEERLDGFNVTIPYKQAILSHLDAIDDEARAIGAVNCVSVHRIDGILHLTGHNTDNRAFAETLKPLLQSWHRRALVLGTGGAAHAVAYALQRLGIDYTFVSRHPRQHPDTIGYGQVADNLVGTGHSEPCTVLINATPLGMWPRTDQTPLPDLEGVGSEHLCYDLVYNPPQSRWLHDCSLRGATVCNGLAMLYRQADMSHQLWSEGI